MADKNLEHRILTRAKVLDILKEVTKTNNVEIVGLEVKAGTEPGENYSSDMVSVLLTYLCLVMQLFVASFTLPLKQAPSHTPV